VYPLKNGRHHADMSGAPVVINNSSTLFDLVQGAVELHGRIMRDRSRIFKDIRDYFLFGDHRACAALRALDLRCAGVSLFARALPPFNPPSRPSATAAGFFFDFALSVMPVAWHEFESH
jgi:hypothetical protein